MKMSSKEDAIEFRNLLLCLPGEVVELDELVLTLVQGGQGVEGLVQVENVDALLFEDREHVVERNMTDVSAALLRRFGAGMVYENPSHGLGRGIEEVCAVLDRL